MSDISEASIFTYVFGSDTCRGLAEITGEFDRVVNYDITQAEFERIVNSYLCDDLRKEKDAELRKEFLCQKIRNELFAHLQSLEPEHIFAGFIARDEQAIWGSGVTMAACKKSAIYWRNGGIKYGDATLNGLDYAKATAMAFAAVEVNGADAECCLRFNGRRDKCWHKAEI